MKYINILLFKAIKEKKSLLKYLINEKVNDFNIYYFMSNITIHFYIL